MDLTLPGLLRLARETIQDPKGGARRIMALDAPMGARWSALALMAVASALLTHASFALAPPATRDFFATAMASPLRTAVLQGAAMVLGVMAIHRIGVARGGRGALPEAISLMAWLQFILLVLQVAQLVAQVILPPLAEIIGVLGIGLFFYLLTNFVAELHGFRSLASTFMGILATMILIAFVLALLLGAVTGPAQVA